MPPEDGETLDPLSMPGSDDVVRADAQSDYTASTASNRALYINLGLIRFGTADPLQGAAIFLAVILLLIGLVAIVRGFWDVDFATTAFAWLNTPLMLAIGVAVGRGGTSGSE